MQAYEAPEITTIGSLSETTMATLDGPQTDHIFYTVGNVHGDAPSHGTQNISAAF